MWFSTRPAVVSSDFPLYSPITKSHLFPISSSANQCTNQPFSLCSLPDHLHSPPQALHLSWPQMFLSLPFLSLSESLTFGYSLDLSALVVCHRLYHRLLSAKAAWVFVWVLASVTAATCPHSFIFRSSTLDFNSHTTQLKFLSRSVSLQHAVAAPDELVHFEENQNLPL